MLNDPRRPIPAKVTLLTKLLVRLKSTKAKALVAGVLLVAGLGLAYATGTMPDWIIDLLVGLTGQ